jgi:(1->4)-alpha-D-glucan 1-alpha-D-glucosylmutase
MHRALLPVLGEPFGEVLEAGQLRLTFEHGQFAIHYFEHRFPLAPLSYAIVIAHGLPDLEAALGADAPDLHELKSILTAISHLPPRSERDPEKLAERQREKEIIKRRLARLTADSGDLRGHILKAVEHFNGKPGDPRSFDPLDQLLADQAYRLSYWRVASDEINYRRFFDINELAALSMEKPEVFQSSHELVMQLLGRGAIDGLRIDHPDGLFDPREYLERLQHQFLLSRARRVYDSEKRDGDPGWKDLEPELKEQIKKRLGAEPAGPLYTLVEKILAGNEDFPDDWKSHGTSGYDFLNVANGLFVDPTGEEGLTRFYHQWIDDPAKFSEIAYQKKYLVLRDALSSELHMLGRQLDRLAQKNRWSRDFTQNGLRFALRQIIACFPVYRSYIAHSVGEKDKKVVELAVRRAIKRNPTISKTIFRYVRDMLLLKYPESATEEERAEQRRFVGKFQQVTSPVAAKGVEDTAFYVYNRLLSLNEVGGEPGKFGVAPAAVHRFNQTRQARWPRAMSTLSTHDTKRSEDVRARINVLSELPERWTESIARWSRVNSVHRQVVDESPAPDANEEYLIYQTLLGAWPLQLETAGEFQPFADRVKAYMLKALSEAKVHTSWINPNDAYNDAITKYIDGVLNAENREFLDDFLPFQRTIRHHGMLNALAQTLLKFASPGVPDTYQGTEIWDFSLVDPDNRRPIDYTCRSRMLDDLIARRNAGTGDDRELVRELLAQWPDGRIKMWLTTIALRARLDHPVLFTEGGYQVGEAAGAKAEHLFAFARTHERKAALVAVPRLTVRLAGAENWPLGDVWGDTSLHVSEWPLAGRRWRNLLTGADCPAGEQGWKASDLFADFPVALLVADEEKAG